MRSRLWPLWGLLLLMPFATRADSPPLAPTPRIVIVGGGPSPEHNQVAIESNVRYVRKLLPPGAVRTTLFADGDAARETVLYEEEAKPLSEGERVFGLLTKGSEGGSAATLHYRKPNLGGALDGASRRADLTRVFTQLQQEANGTTANRPLFLYFTGHGSPDEGDRENNAYDLWGKDERLSVRDLAAQIARLPASVPVTLVMVQCFSGAFGNLIFEGGDPKGKVIDRDIAGFFATIKERPAAGCTPEVNEAEYHDFTSYFFAALTGRDRVGRRVTGADYNGDGRVGMDEAYCYALANDESIDIPVCTSDVFLRRFVTRKDAALFQARYSEARSWATPAQRMALDALSTRLKLSGEDRLSVAYNREFRDEGEDGAGQKSAVRRAARRFETARQEGWQQITARWPDLRREGTPEYERAKKEAIALLNRQAGEGKWDDLLDAETALGRAMEAQYTAELAESRLLRFIRLAKSVILAHTLRETGEPAIKARFERLIEAEGRTPLPPADLAQGTAQPAPVGEYALTTSVAKYTDSGCR
ncbi:MAG TPA: hypothetical protein VFB21_21880 [Chthonomonadaceae bacterium]|nr:hypothetical protein [Chthonomonadaceae bacterium]